MSKLYFKAWLSATAESLQYISESPALDAQLILSFCTGLSRSALFALTETEYTDNPLIIAQCISLLHLRQQGYPIAYLTGSKEFYGYRFAVCPGVLIPRPDSECLIEAMVQTYPTHSCHTLRDIGTGSGALALTLAKLYPKWHVTGSDISLTSRRIFSKNCRLLQIDNAHFLRKNLLHGGLPYYDIIVANLPYLTPAETEEKKKQEHWVEPALALNGKSKDGLALIKKLIRQARHRCHSLYLEADPRQMPTLQQYLLKYGFREIQIYPDLSGTQRIIHAKWKKD